MRSTWPIHDGADANELPGGLGADRRTGQAGSDFALHLSRSQPDGAAVGL